MKTDIKNNAKKKKKKKKKSKEDEQILAGLSYAHFCLQAKCQQTS